MINFKVLLALIHFFQDNSENIKKHIFSFVYICVVSIKYQVQEQVTIIVLKCIQFNNEYLFWLQFTMSPRSLVQYSKWTRLCGHLEQAKRPLSADRSLLSVRLQTVWRIFCLVALIDLVLETQPILLLYTKLPSVQEVVTHFIQ